MVRPIMLQHCLLHDVRFTNRFAGPDFHMHSHERHDDVMMTYSVLSRIVGHIYNLTIMSSNQPHNFTGSEVNT